VPWRGSWPATIDPPTEPRRAPPRDPEPMRENERARDQGPVGRDRGRGIPGAAVEDGEPADPRFARCGGCFLGNRSRDVPRRAAQERSPSERVTPSVERGDRKYHDSHDDDRTDEARGPGGNRAHSAKTRPVCWPLALELAVMPCDVGRPAQPLSRLATGVEQE
jgi:hypothetical protein